MVHDFSNRKLKKLYPDLNFISPFVRNKSDTIKHIVSYIRDTTVMSLLRFCSYKIALTLSNQIIFMKPQNISSQTISYSLRIEKLTFPVNHIHFCCSKELYRSRWETFLTRPKT